MKRQLLSAFMLIGFIMAATFAAPAQTARRIVIKVPFDFMVGKKSLPAGTYTIKQLTRDNDKVLLVQSADARTAQVVATNQVERNVESEVAQLDFHRYGDTYFLFRVWTPGVQTGRELTRSQSERLVIREFARGAAQPGAVQPQTVSVNGRLE
jgi:hypothetical protein